MDEFNPKINVSNLCIYGLKDGILKNSESTKHYLARFVLKI